MTHKTVSFYLYGILSILPVFKGSLGLSFLESVAFILKNVSETVSKGRKFPKIGIIIIPFYLKRIKIILFVYRNNFSFF